MVSISLPELPKGKELEEFVSAFFQSNKYYIERNILRREVEDVLELDIITTNYNRSPPEINLLEMKSGRWGFTDIFKVRGWMDYLNITKGVFITSKERYNIDFYKKIAKQLNIDLVYFPSLKQSKEALFQFVNNENIEDVDIDMWRFSYWVERNLLKQLNHKKKSLKDKKSFEALDEYYFEVNNGIFFTDNVAEKVFTLYSTFQKYPYISAKCGNELIGNNFDDDHKFLPEKIFNETFYECSFNDIQISTFIEHRARLAILKNAIDYKLYKNAGVESKANGLGSNTFLSMSLPDTFKEGLNSISEHKYSHKYPIFWQWFMWVFGGFILKDYEEKEYEILSKKTGIPISEIPNAFKSYEILFPLSNGWFQDLPNSNIRMMKMFPLPFSGIGANYRRLLYTSSAEFKDLNLTGLHTRNDLIKWNNLTIKVLNNR